MNNVLFEIFNQDERRILTEVAVVHKYTAGEVVVREGEEGDALYFVTKGGMEARKGLKDKLFKPLRLLERGDMFGEIAFLGISTRSATVVAIEESEALEISKDRFNVLEQKYPDLALKLYRTMAENMAHRLAGTSEELKKAILVALE